VYEGEIETLIFHITIFDSFAVQSFIRYIQYVQAAYMVDMAYGPESNNLPPSIIFCLYGYIAQGHVLGLRIGFILS